MRKDKLIIMPEFIAMVNVYSFATIEAKNKDEAFEIAKELTYDNYNWSTDGVQKFLTQKLLGRNKYG